MTDRCAFVVSDRTGLTAEALANSLLCQFPSLHVRPETMVFIDTVKKANDVVTKVNAAFELSGEKPLLFMTIVDDSVRETIMSADAVFYDLFGTFIEPMEKELGMHSSHTVGKSHGVTDQTQYTSRISAVHFSLTTDDGLETEHYKRADLIVIGVSRSGKTPTSLYLSLHYGLFVANYPLTIDELSQKKLPDVLLQHKEKLIGLTIDSHRLLQIRQERYKGDSYSSSKSCQEEVAQAEAIFRSQKVPVINTTKMSIEEIGAKIVQRMGIRRNI